MNMSMLAEITSKMDISGVFCLASIVFIIIAILAFSTGPWSGSGICLLFFIIAMFATGDSSESEGPLAHHANKAFIANESQTKWIEKDKYDINHPDARFDTPTSRGYGEDTTFLPGELIERKHVSEDWAPWVMKDTGKEITSDDYYLYDKTFSPANVSREHGGMGIPQWVYHPASPVWIFGLCGTPALLGGMFLSRKLAGIG